MSSQQWSWEVSVPWRWHGRRGRHARDRPGQSQWTPVVLAAILLATLILLLLTYV
ncbi:hypothetical protein [Saccharothrix violaceirubra]|uniref:Uncharacterized protein n=1 Tax=Saccharothrix violaceirubra TaxID=413306 RepID=A0A7W7T6P7_9PSEU|nr:hypothetical protein [Saccharothrix violaceirubra]MBB4967581.1 hypothetical protein [Saccharothrix violaceirubra]